MFSPMFLTFCIFKGSFINRLDVISSFCLFYRTEIHNYTADLCLWTFKLSSVKEINLFLLTHVFLIFPFLLPLVFFLLFSLVSAFGVSGLTTPCPVSPLLFLPLLCPPSLLLYKGQVQGSPITLRGLRKLYGLCPRGCHVALSSARLQVRCSHWLPAQQPQP